MDQKPKSCERSSSTPNKNSFGDSFPRAMRGRKTILFFFLVTLTSPPGHPSAHSISWSYVQCLHHVHGELHASLLQSSNIRCFRAVVPGEDVPFHWSREAAWARQPLAGELRGQQWGLPRSHSLGRFLWTSKSKSTFFPIAIFVHMPFPNFFLKW